MNEPLKNKLEYEGPNPIFYKDNLESAIRWLKNELWIHPRIFCGDKCRTSLSLDYVEELINTTFPDLDNID